MIKFDPDREIENTYEKKQATCVVRNLKKRRRRDNVSPGRSVMLVI